jgi:hypothetical protein
MANILNPNFPQNTFVFNIFEAPDTRSNLHIGLDRYKEQVDEIMWK